MDGLQQEAQNMDTHAAGWSLEQLGEVISLGSLVLQGHEWMVTIAVLVFSWLLVLTVVQYHQSAARTRLLMGITRALADLEVKVSGGQPQQLAPSSETLTALQCLDAKMLQLSHDNQQLRVVHQQLHAFMDELQQNRTLPLLESTVQQIAAVADETGKKMDQWMQEVPPRIKEIYGFTSALPRTEKAVASMALDTAKNFGMQETLSDGLLKQGRESLHYLQSEQKFQGDKLTEIKTTTEELHTTLKQTSVDLHVAKTRSEQKQESIHKDIQALAGSTASSFRGINVLVPAHKTLMDHVNNILDYLVKANQANAKADQDLLSLQEITGNTDTRALRIESLLGGLQETLAEVQEVVLQMGEAQKIVQEQVQIVLDRTPKILKRPPPSGDTASSAQPATPPPSQVPLDPPVQQQPQPSPIRLSEHLQPLAATGQQPIWMVQDPLRSVSTTDLLRTLLSRGNF
ncbi:unnamed protein product [Symbiodinium sp. CCMP2592]|nr:unnamed protein product [Symbiodinium sp. CCMP2592]